MVIGIGFFLDGGGMVCRDHSVAQILSPPVDPIPSLYPQTETLKPLVPYFSTKRIMSGLYHMLFHLIVNIEPFNLSQKTENIQSL